MTYDHMKDPSRFQDVVLDPLPVPDIWLTKRIRELEAENKQLREALENSTHREHTLPNSEKCRCGQCEFVRMRDAALNAD